MIIFTQKPSNEMIKKELDDIKNYIKENGLTWKEIEGEQKNIICVLGDAKCLDKAKISVSPSVLNCITFSTPYKLASREYKKQDTIINVRDVSIGGNKNVVVMAGPCSIESEEMTYNIGKEVQKSGAQFLRGGAYKPRTSPYSFQGLEKEGIYEFKSAADKLNIPIVSEIISSNDIDLFVQNVDIIQVGARNMQNFELLKALGKIDKPILLKRGPGNTIEELLMSAEYILAGGNSKVILCERGIKTFEHSTRYTLDISSIPYLKKISHLPVVVDPSHATGSWDLVESMSLAAVAAGADGLLVEVHHARSESISDAKQALTTSEFDVMMQKLKKVAEAIGKTVGK